MKKALLAFALLLFPILPAYADQMGPIGSELYEEGTLSYGGSLSEIIFSWSVEEPVSSGFLDIEIFGDLNNQTEYVSVYEENSLLFAQLNGGTQFELAHSYSLNWTNPSWAFDKIISFTFVPSQAMDSGVSLNTSQPDYLKATLNANPVPEPSTMILFATGLIGIVGWGRARFKKGLPLS